MKKIILFGVFVLVLVPITIAQSASPPYDMGHREAYAVFSDAVRNGDHEMALKFGEWMLVAKPKEIEKHNTFSLARQFDRLIRIYTDLAGQEKDPSEKSRYLQRALDVFELTFETFSEEEIDYFQWYYRKGRFYQENRRFLTEGLHHAFKNYEQAYFLNAERFVKLGEGYFAQILLRKYASSGQKEKAFSMIESIEPYADESLKSVIHEMRDKLFDTPEERIVFLESNLAEPENKEDLKAILEQLTVLYEATGQRDKSAETVLKLYNLNPDFENTRKAADVYMSRGDYRTALDFLHEILAKNPSAEAEKKTTLEIAETYQLLGNLKSAREYVNKAIEMDNAWGDAYIRKAAIYASAITRCTEGRTLERNDRTVYWLVLDYLEKAKDTDPSLQSLANRRIQSFTPVLPNPEDKFFRGWKEGDHLKIDSSIGDCYGWINETVTVR